jgi:hypothetical protein
MKQRLQMGVAVEVDDVETDDVCRTLESVLLEALRELQADGRYADLKIAGPVAITRTAA